MRAQCVCVCESEVFVSAQDSVNALLWQTGRLDPAVAKAREEQESRVRRFRGDGARGGRQLPDKQI